MAEQFVTAYTVSLERLYGLVGSRKDSVIKKALDHDQADEVGELIEERGPSLEEILQELVSKRLNREHAYEYRRLLELLLPIVGKPLEPQGVTVPGRGWQELREVLPSWGLPELGKVWCEDTFHFPWRRRPSKVVMEWPMAMSIASTKIPSLAHELKSFDPFGIGALLGMPEIPVRPEIPERLEGCTFEALFLVDKIKGWMVRASRARGKDVVILLDGQQ